MIWTGDGILGEVIAVLPPSFISSVLWRWRLKKRPTPSVHSQPLVTACVFSQSANNALAQTNRRCCFHTFQCLYRCLRKGCGRGEGSRHLLLRRWTMSINNSCFSAFGWVGETGSTLR